MNSELPLYKVLTTKEAKADLRELRDYIERHADRRTAREYIARLKQYAGSLALAPLRGSSVPHFIPGMRKIGFERRVDIIFVIFLETYTVEIQGFDYGGRQRW